MECYPAPRGQRCAALGVYRQQLVEEDASALELAQFIPAASHAEEGTEGPGRFPAQALEMFQRFSGPAGLEQVLGQVQSSLVELRVEVHRPEVILQRVFGGEQLVPDQAALEQRLSVSRLALHPLPRACQRLRKAIGTRVPPSQGLQDQGNVVVVLLEAVPEVGLH